ncbi:MAG: hypothetical protein ACXVYV_02900 [Gaiellales bacterium]
MDEASTRWQDDLPVGTLVKITYVDGSTRAGFIDSQRSDDFLKLRTEPNPAEGAIFFANTANIIEIEILSTG